MKKNKILVLLLFIIAFSSAMMIACNSSYIIVPTDYKADGWCKVNMYYNGGLEGGNYDTLYFFKKNARIPLPGMSGQSNLSNPTRTGYDFYAWYEVKADLFDYRKEYLYEKDDKGENILSKPTYNTKGEHASIDIPYIEGHDFLNEEKEEYGLTLRDYEDEQEDGYQNEKIFIKKWNFDFDKVTDDTCLVAIWQAKRQYVIVPPEYRNDNFDEEGYNKLEFFNIGASGDIQVDVLRSRADSFARNFKPGVQVKDFYFDRRCREKLVFGSNRYYPEAEYDEATGKFKIVPIYIDWLDGKYTKIASASSMRSITENASYYIMNDLDFSGQTLSVPANYRGTIAGNGYVWRNLTITIEEQAKDVTVYGGIFKNLVGAKISDITFENLTIRFVRVNKDAIGAQFWLNPYTVNLFAASMDARTYVTNVKMGTGNDNSTISVIDYTAFGGVYDELILENGHEIRYSLEHGEIHYDVDKYGPTGYPEDGQMLWSEKRGEIYELKYLRDYIGNIQVMRERAIDLIDGKALYGYTKYLAPDYAKDNLIIKQFGANFGIVAGDLLANNIISCECNLTQVNVDYEWEITFNRGSDLPQLANFTPQNSSTRYNFAGWYTEDFVKVESGDNTLDAVTLTAYWKIS